MVYCFLARPVTGDAGILLSKVCSGGYGVGARLHPLLSRLMMCPPSSWLTVCVSQVGRRTSLRLCGGLQAVFGCRCDAALLWLWLTSEGANEILLATSRCAAFKICSRPLPGGYCSRGSKSDDIHTSPLLGDKTNELRHGGSYGAQGLLVTFNLGFAGDAIGRPLMGRHLWSTPRRGGQHRSPFLHLPVVAGDRRHTDICTSVAQPDQPG